jgi:hypothetical protein
MILGSLKFNRRYHKGRSHSGSEISFNFMPPKSIALGVIFEMSELV